MDLNFEKVSLRICSDLSPLGKILKSQGFVLLKHFDSDEQFLNVIQESVDGKFGGHDGHGILKRIITKSETVQDQPSDETILLQFETGDESVPPFTEGYDVVNGKPPKFIAQAIAQAPQIGGEFLFINGRSLKYQLQQNYPSLFQLLSDPTSNVAKFYQNDTWNYLPVFDEAGFIRYHSSENKMIIEEPKAKNQLEALIKENTIQISLGVGEGFILNNYFWLHGRNPFNGNRNVTQVLIYEN